MPAEIPMTPLMITALGLLMVATAFLSGLFGMAGGLILIGVLLTILPLPSAMVLPKATCQVASDSVKLSYFGGIVDQAATLDPVVATVAVAASMTGTTLARRILEAMTDTQFRTWAGRLITTVAGYYILYGSWLLLVRSNAFAF